MVYSGSCLHQMDKRKGTKGKVEHMYGTAYCQDCTASRGIDGRWRVIEEPVGEAAKEAASPK